MKNKIIKIVTAFAAMLVLVSMVAMAAPEISENVILSGGNFTTTINVTSVGTNDEVSLLVVKAGTDLTKLTAKDVLYVDQTTAVSGAASFDFITATDAFDVYSGYSTMSITDNPLFIKYQTNVVFPGVDTQKSKLYTTAEPFGLKGCRRIFIKLTKDNGRWIPSHLDESSEIYYSTELGGYDGIIKTSSQDLAQILTEIEWANGIPSSDATIAKYGDVSDDGVIKVSDYVSVRKSLLGSTTYNIKQKLTADVTDDGLIKVNDYVDIRKSLLGSLKEFTAVSGRK